MTLNDLQSLKLAIDTNNPGFYHGNMDDALSALVDELLEIEEHLDDVDSNAGVENVGELVSLYNGAMNEVAKLEEDKGNIVEVLTGCTCIKEGGGSDYTIYNKDGKLNVDSFAITGGMDYEIIVRKVR